MEAIPNLIPIRINLDMLKSHGIEIINYPTFVIFKFLPKYFLKEVLSTSEIVYDKASSLINVAIADSIISSLGGYKTFRKIS